VADLLVGFGQEEDVVLGHDPLALQPDHGERLGDRQGFHVVGPAADQVAEVDGPVEGGVFPVRSMGLGHVDVVEQQERIVRAAAGETGEDVAPTGRRAHDLGLDLFALEETPEEVGPLLLAVGRAGVDAHIVLEEADGLLAKPFLRGPADVVDLRGPVRALV
jgi:hypothetical protein